MIRMSRSAVGDTGTITRTSTLGESKAFRPVRMWWQMFSGGGAVISTMHPGGRLPAPKYGPEYSSPGLATAGTSNTASGTRIRKSAIKVVVSRFCM
jgi:hypothetical protein